MRYKSMTTRLLILILLPILLNAQPQITNSTVVGGVTENSARIWVRLSEAGTINVELSENKTFTNVIRGSEQEISPESNYAGIVDVSGLFPSTKYFFRILLNGNVIPDKVRSFRTFPIAGIPANFSFGFGSCQQSGNFLPSDTQSGNVFREIIKHNLDFFMQIGDWTYPDTTDELPDNNNYFSAAYVRVQKDYEAKYNELYPMDSLLRSMPVDYIYDDHDYINDNCSALTSSFGIAEKPNPFGKDFVIREITAPAGTRENSIRGYKENFPSYKLVNESRGIYHKFMFGNAEFFVLDLRSQRSPNFNSLVKNNSTGKWIFSPPSGHTILGRDSMPGTGENQLSWFLSSIRNSTSKWKFIVSSVAFNRSQRAIIDISIQLQDLTFNIPGYMFGLKGIAAAMEVVDKWAGFPEDIDTVISFIASNNIKNVVVLSGDTHTSAIDDGANAGLPELMAANLDITNSKIVAGLENLGIHIWNRGGQGITTDQFNNAFGRVTVYGNDSLNLSLIDENGNRFASYTIKDQEETSAGEHLEIPNDYYSISNYPNPFNNSTRLQITLGQDAYIILKVFDVLGREISTLINEKKLKGNYNINFDSFGLSAGVYVCDFLVRDAEQNHFKFHSTRKLLLLK